MVLLNQRKLIQIPLFTKKKKRRNRYNEISRDNLCEKALISYVENRNLVKTSNRITVNINHCIL